MSELMEAMKLLEDAMNKRSNLDTQIERLQNELFRLVQRRRVSPIVAPRKKIGRPKGRKDSKPRTAKGTRFAIPKVPFSQLSPTQQLELRREWGRKGKAVVMMNRAAKQNGVTIAVE